MGALTLSPEALRQLKLAGWKRGETCGKGPVPQDPALGAGQDQGASNAAGAQVRTGLETRPGWHVYMAGVGRTQTGRPGRHSEPEPARLTLSSLHFTGFQWPAEPR